MSRQKYIKKVKRLAGPSKVMVFVVLVMIIGPTTYIAMTDYYSTYWYWLSFDEYRKAAWMALYIAIIFLTFFAIGLFFSRLAKAQRFSSGTGKKVPRVSKYSQKEIVIPALLEDGSVHLISRHRIIFWIALFSALVIWLVFLTGGYQKIAQYGQDIDKLDYRLIGFNDRNRVVTAIIQIVRRLILPFCIVYFSLLRGYSEKYSLRFLLFLMVSLFVGVIMTLDRGPLMLLVVMLFYIAYMRAKYLPKLLISASVAVVSVVFLGGFLTFIQYNIQVFNFSDVLETGLNFLTNRAIMAPNFVPIELSYGIFDFSAEKLFLRYSRLTALFTGNYVGTLQESSLYVGPVGVIADIWRNLGIIGIILIGFLLGIFFSILDRNISKMDPMAQGASTFTVISLVFYFYYGTFFSQGVFLQIFFLLGTRRFFRKDAKRFVQ